MSRRRREKERDGEKMREKGRKDKREGDRENVCVCVWERSRKSEKK